MLNKKGQLLFSPIIGIVYLVLVIIILALLVWFGYKISGIFGPIWDFFVKWWWAIALTIVGFLWHAQLVAIVNKLLGFIGIKV